MRRLVKEELHEDDGGAEICGRRRVCARPVGRHDRAASDGWCWCGAYPHRGRLRFPRWGCQGSLCGAWCPSLWSSVFGAPRMTEMAVGVGSAPYVGV